MYKNISTLLNFWGEFFGVVDLDKNYLYVLLLFIYFLKMVWWWGWEGPSTARGAASWRGIPPCDALRGLATMVGLGWDRGLWAILGALVAMRWAMYLYI